MERTAQAIVATSVYRLIRSIRITGSSQTYEASFGSAGFQRRVIIKQPAPELLRDKSLLRSFFDEARILSHLRHNNVVNVIDFIASRAGPAIVLEYIEGLSLAQLKEKAEEAKRPIPEEFALYICSELAQALAYIHDARGPNGDAMSIVHRDVNPSNILISWDGDVRLADFGIAKASNRLEHTEIGTTKGTVDFMAPEQCAGAHVDRRADIFSLGCVLHWVIAGYSPVSVVLDNTVQFVTKLEPSLPPDIARVVSRCIRDEPRRRYRNAAGLAHDCWELLSRYAPDHPRSKLRDWLSELKTPDRSSKPLAGLFDLSSINQGGKERRSEAELTRRIATEQPSALVVHRDRWVDEALEPTALVGRVLAGYKLDSFLGGERMWRFAARHDLLQDRRLLELSSGKHAAPKDHPLMTKVRAFASVRHESVVPVLDCGATEGGRLYVVTQDPDGRTLASLVALAAPIPLVRMLSIAKQIVAGLIELKKAGLSPVLVDPHCVVMVERGAMEVAAIGFSRMHNGGDETSDESAWRPKGGRTSGIQGDLYALGAMMYAMVEGHPPPVAQNGGALPAAGRMNGGDAISSVIVDLLDQSSPRRIASYEGFQKRIQHLELHLSESPTEYLDGGAARTKVTTGVSTEAVLEPKRRFHLGVVVALVVLASVGLFLWFHS